MDTVKVFRAFVRYDGSLKVLYVQAHNLEEALHFVREEPDVLEVLNINEEADAIIIN